MAALRAVDVKITWRKVQSHTGVRWNERADQLAKQGVNGGSVSNPTLAEPPADLIAPLEAHTREFVDHLVIHGIQAKWNGTIINRQYARIIVPGGVLDLYNTVKRPFQPYLHDFANSAVQAQIERLWYEFSHHGQKTDNTFQELDEYYTRLKPYADKAFDFYLFAAALAPFAASVAPQFDPELVRYDFAKLEILYKQLREHNDRRS